VGAVGGKISIVGLNGSPHGRDCITVRLLSQALGGAQEHGATTKIVHLVDELPQAFRGLRNVRVSEHFQPLLEKLSEADALLIATPVWWGAPTPLVMNFLAHLTPTCDSATYPLQGLPVGVITVCEEDGAQTAAGIVTSALNMMGCVIIPFGIVWHNKTMAHLSERQWQQTDVDILGRRLAMAAEILGPHRSHDWDRMPVLTHED
jgi:multimeric flavodoxin WrbA